MINFNLLNKNIFFFKIVVLFFISRFVILHIFGIELNGANFGYHTAHYDLLRYDLIQTTLFQHSQPFFWNLYLGTLIKIANGNIASIESAFLFINILLSFGIIYYAFLISKFFNFSIQQSFFLLIILALNPSILFYENLFSYHQLTAFLFTQACYFIFMLVHSKKTKYEMLFYLNLSFLGFVWSAFQPLLIIVIFFIIRIVLKIKFTKNLLIFLTIVLLSFAPHIKNKVIFGSFTSSSWSGHGFSTVFNPEWLEFCGHPLEKQLYYKDQYEKKFKKLFDHPSLVGKKSLFNNVGLVYKSPKCFSLTLKKIINEPETYIYKSYGNYSFPWKICI